MYAFTKCDHLKNNSWTIIWTPGLSIAGTWITTGSTRKSSHAKEYGVSELGVTITSAADDIQSISNSSMRWDPEPESTPRKPSITMYNPNPW